MANQFGEYVITRRLAAEHQLAVYRARKQDRPALEKFEQYVVIVFGTWNEVGPSPHPPDLDQDAQRRFVEAVKLQKKAREEGIPNIVPVRELGVAPQGAWYASDYYARGFLKKWISQRAGVTEEELRHIVLSVVEGLSALKRKFKRTHGRLGPSCILIGGKIGTPLRDAPIHLTYLQPGDEPEAAAFERNDLKALGLIIYQLVGRQDIGSFNPDFFPIPPSEPWMQLGKHGDYWRGLCNRLLDPQLSLETLNIETLADELKPKRTAAGLVLGMALAILVLVAGLAFYWKYSDGAMPRTRNATPPSEPVSTSQVQVVQIPSAMPAPSSHRDTSSTEVLIPPPNTPPAISPITNQIIELGQPLIPIRFTVHDRETPPSNLVVKAKSLNPGLISDPSILLGGSGSNRTMTFPTNFPQTGTAPLVLWVEDGSLSATNLFVVKVKPAYQPPVLKGLTDQSVKLGAPTVRIPFQVAESDLAAEGIYVGVASSNPSFIPPASVRIEGSGASRVLVIDPAPQQVGQAIFAVSVSDARTNLTESFWFRVTR